MSNPIPERYREIIHYDEEWQVFVCLKHNHNVLHSSLALHLQQKHKMGYREYRPLMKAIEGLKSPNSQESCPRPPDGSPPIKGLPILDGTYTFFSKRRLIH